MRNELNRQLEKLKQKLCEMAETCSVLTGQVSDALLTGNKQESLAVLSHGQEVDVQEKDIQQRCLKLLLLQQPVAHDLRMVSAGLKIITDLERIGDQCEEIARIQLELSEASYPAFENLTRISCQMISLCGSFFTAASLEKADSIIAMDDQADEAFLQIKTTLIEQLETHGIDGDEAINLLMIAKYYERISDHAVNVARWTIYSLSGTVPDEQKSFDALTETE